MSAARLFNWLDESIRAGNLDGDLPQLRTVERWVQGWRGARNKRTGTAALSPDWEPWDDQTTPEEHAYLLRINFTSQVWLGRPIVEREARWARRIRVAVAGLDLFVQWFLIREYSARDLVREEFDLEKAETSDLDALLAIRPWEPGGRDRYLHAIREGLAPQLSYEVASVRYAHWMEPLHQSEWILASVTGTESPFEYSWEGLVGWHLATVREFARSEASNE
jgi:hypothetical protein